MPDIKKIIHDFGRVQEEISKKLLTHYPALKFPVSLLPYKKEEIALAIDGAIEIVKNDQDKVELLKSARAFLDGFVDDQEAYDANHKLLGKEEYWEAIRSKHSNS